MWFLYTNFPKPRGKIRAVTVQSFSIADALIMVLEIFAKISGMKNTTNYHDSAVAFLQSQNNRILKYLQNLLKSCDFLKSHGLFPILISLSFAIHFYIYFTSIFILFYNFNLKPIIIFNIIIILFYFIFILFWFLFPIMFMFMLMFVFIYIFDVHFIVIFILIWLLFLFYVHLHPHFYLSQL